MSRLCISSFYPFFVSKKAKKAASMIDNIQAYVYIPLSLFFSTELHRLQYSERCPHNAIEKKA
jgi:hypothetical protein